MELMAYRATPKKWHRPQVVRSTTEDVPPGAAPPNGTLHKGRRTPWGRGPKMWIWNPGPPRGRSESPGVDLRLQHSSEGPGILQPITDCMENTNTLSPLKRPLSNCHAQVIGKYIHLDHPRQPKYAQDHKTLIFLRFFQGLEPPNIGFP